MRITISRQKLYPTPGRAYTAAWKWSYSYLIDGAETSWGPHLSSLIGTLKRRNRNAWIVTDWDNKKR